MSEWLDGFSMAWGMFLAIPCPLRRWNEKAREKMLVCLPLVGLAVGGIWLGLYLLLRHAAIGGLYAFLMAALPWLVTGFMHLDGYMDVCDAVLSRRELATRLPIGKAVRIHFKAGFLYLLLGIFFLIGKIIIPQQFILPWFHDSFTSSKNIFLFLKKQFRFTPRFSPISRKVICTQVTQVTF